MSKNKYLAFYNKVIGLYPEAFKKEFRSSLLDCFEQELAAAESGPRKALVSTMGSLDVVKSAYRERIRSAVSKNREAKTLNLELLAFFVAFVITLSFGQYATGGAYNLTTKFFIFRELSQITFANYSGWIIGGLLAVPLGWLLARRVKWQSSYLFAFGVMAAFIEWGSIISYWFLNRLLWIDFSLPYPLLNHWGNIFGVSIFISFCFASLCGVALIFLVFRYLTNFITPLRLKGSHK